MTYMSYSQYFLPNLMDMGSLLGTILGTILNYKRILMSTAKGPLIRLILTVAHIVIVLRATVGPERLPILF